MATVNRKSVTIWATAVNEVLGAAGIKKAELAEELGVSHVVVVRFLSGDRTPSSENVLRIDRTVARLAGHQGVELFLNLSAAVCDQLQKEHFGDEPLAKGVAQCLRWYSNFFKGGAIERIHEIISALDEPKRRKLTLALNRALRGVVISELLPSSTPGFRAVYDALDAGGINLEEVVSEQCAVQLAWERFSQTVQRELAAQNRRTPARERLGATQRILEAITIPVLAAIEVSMDGASEGVLREVSTTENGKRVSRFYGDSKAAWAPFMPPKRQAITEFNDSSSVRRKGGHT